MIHVQYFIHLKQWSIYTYKRAVRSEREVALAESASKRSKPDVVSSYHRWSWLGSNIDDFEISIQGYSAFLFRPLQTW